MAGLDGHYPICNPNMTWSDCHAANTYTLLLLLGEGFDRERHGYPKFHCESLNDPLWSTTPARRWHTRHYRVQRCWLPNGVALGPMQLVTFRGLQPSLALWLTILLSLSPAYLVTSVHIKFRSGLVANL